MRILFLGDSITDADRSRDNDTLGCGYPVMVAGDLGFAEPGCHTFLNRGISGNRVVDLYARIKADVWNLEPDVMSILIGVNDVSHELGAHNGVDAQRFEKVYRMLLEDTKAACPDLKIILMEPFVLPGTATAEDWEYFHTEVAKRAEVTRNLAEEFHLPLVLLQERLNQACENAPAGCWLVDGVHPTAAGHRMLANAWLEIYHKIEK